MTLQTPSFVKQHYSSVQMDLRLIKTGVSTHMERQRKTLMLFVQVRSSRSYSLSEDAAHACFATVSNKI